VTSPVHTGRRALRMGPQQNPLGQEDEAPGWRFEAGGARVVTKAENVRGGVHAVALEGIPTDFRQVTQEIRELTGAPRYRVSAWLKTAGLTIAPTIFAWFDVGGNQIVAQTTSEGVYRYVSSELIAPAGARPLEHPPAPRQGRHRHDVLRRHTCRASRVANP
jgi:hypothetical protein